MAPVGINHATIFIPIFFAIAEVGILLFLQVWILSYFLLRVLPLRWYWFVCIINLFLVDS